MKQTTESIPNQKITEHALLQIIVLLVDNKSDNTSTLSWSSSCYYY